MGANFWVACHKCEEYAFALRGFDTTGETLTKFFHKHYKCGKEAPDNVEVYWDYFEDMSWVDDESYKDVTEEVCERYKLLQKPKQ